MNLSQQGNGWLEVSLEVDGELAEAVAEVLTRFVPNGVAIESTTVYQDEGEQVAQTVGRLRVVGYLPWDERTEQVRQELTQALWYLGRISPLPPANFRYIEPTDWLALWKQRYHPIPVGKRLLITPAWMEAKPTDRLPIYIEPGMAFGTGTHPTTQLCLELIEDRLDLWAQEKRPAEMRTLIDLGCGSGILSIAAIKLGAHHVLGVDIDAEVIKTAQENVRRNLLEGRVTLAVGSLQEILEGKFALQRAPLVVVNILATVIQAMLDRGLAKLLTPDGVLVLSGILTHQGNEIESTIEKLHLNVLEQRVKEDWVAYLVGQSLHPSSEV